MRVCMREYVFQQVVHTCDVTRQSSLFITVAHFTMSGAYCYHNRARTFEIRQKIPD